MGEQTCPPATKDQLNEWASRPNTLYETYQIAAQWGWEQAMAWRAGGPDALQAAADAELEACCDWLDLQHHSKTWSSRMRAARRPPVPSLKEQAIKALRESLRNSYFANVNDIEAVYLALRALEGGDG